MSWIERNKTGLTITTGDGKSFTPNWMNASKAIEYNVATFVFKETEGTLVKRGTPRGRQFAIEIYFQGEDHIDLADEFEASAADPKPWTIAHPYYGSILVQPVGMVFDNSGYNVTKITGGLIETISTTPDVPTVSAPDKILADKVAADEAFAQSYADNVPVSKVANVRDIIRNASGAYSTFVANITSNADVEEFLNAYNEANALFRGASTTTANAIRSIQALISLPFKLQADVITRMSMLTNLLVYLNGTIVSGSSRAAKLLYENNAGAVITSMVAAAVTNIGRSYSNRRSVLETIDTILAAYNEYLTKLDAIQTANGGLINSYIPSRFPLSLLGNLVGYAVTSLLDIAADSRQEISFFLEEDSNIIQLAHRLYGLKEDDSTIDELIAVNEIGLNEILGIRKGRKITYYA